MFNLSKDQIVEKNKILDEISELIDNCDFYYAFWNEEDTIYLSDSEYTKYLKYLNYNDYVSNFCYNLKCKNNIILEKFYKSNSRNTLKLNKINSIDDSCLDYYIRIDKSNVISSYLERKCTIDIRFDLLEKSFFLEIFMISVSLANIIKKKSFCISI